MAPGLIDWSAPWYEGLPRIAVEGPVHEALNRTGAAPVRFVPQAELPAGMAYERLIFETGRVPTRDNLHDFFNGLVWLRFPQAKRRLNQLIYKAIYIERDADDLEASASHARDPYDALCAGHEAMDAVGRQMDAETLEATFQRSKLRPHAAHDGRGRVLYDFYRTLLRMRRETPALARCCKKSLEVYADESAGVLHVRRWAPGSEVAVSFRVSDQPGSTRWPWSGDGWHKVFDSAGSHWQGAGSGMPARLALGDVERMRERREHL